MPRVSVLINNRDNEPFLRECVKSALSQTRAPDEVIVYDDGSVDRSLQALGEFGESIRVISGGRAGGTPMENQGLAIAEGFRASTGDFSFLLDSDDAFMPDHIETYMRAFARSSRVIMVQAPLWKTDEAGVIVGLEYDERRHVHDYVGHIKATNEVNIYYPTSALAFRRSYLTQRLPLARSEGSSLWPDARLALVAPHFGDVVTLDEPHTYWRRHARSHTVVTKTSVYEQIRMNCEFYNAFCIQRGLPPVRPWRSPRHLKRWLRHVCPQWLLKPYQEWVGRSLRDRWRERQLQSGGGGPI